MSEKISSRSSGARIDPAIRAALNEWVKRTKRRQGVTIQDAFGAAICALLLHEDEDRLWLLLAFRDRANFFTKMPASLEEWEKAAVVLREAAREMAQTAAGIRKSHSELAARTPAHRGAKGKKRQ